MLTTHLRSQFVTKTLTSSTGEQFRVVFLIALVSGEVKAQVVSVTPLSTKTTTTPCLPGVHTKVLISFTYTPPSVPKLSFFNSLFFFTSQPTRAPSYN